LYLFKALAGLKGLRGTPLDIFGFSAERKLERKLVCEYEALLDDIEENLTPANHADAILLATLPMSIRGFGVVKEKAAAKAEEEKIRLLEAFRNPQKAAAE
jgi:indolepyruvate ferredoxin oxidoreductase